VRSAVVEKSAGHTDTRRARVAVGQPPARSLAAGRRSDACKSGRRAIVSGSWIRHVPAAPSFPAQASGPRASTQGAAGAAKEGRAPRLFGMPARRSTAVRGEGLQSL
jgi:hypothetical protein